MSTTPSLPPLFHEAVRSYRARLYRLTFCGWMVRAAVAFIVPFILSMALDRYWDFSVNIRIGLLVLTFAVPLLSIRWLLPQPIWDSGEESLAGMIDRACPDLRDGLRSSMNLASKDTPWPYQLGPNACVAGRSHTAGWVHWLTHFLSRGPARSSGQEILRSLGQLSSTLLHEDYGRCP